MKHATYWESIKERYKKRPLGMCGLIVLALFLLVACYAPFLASSKPLCVVYDNHLYFPLFRYLLSSAYYTKKIDLFFNALGLLLPFFVASFWLKKSIQRAVQGLLVALFAALFIFFGFFTVLDPAISPYFNQQKEALILQLNATRGARYELPSWALELQYLNPYARLNLVLGYRNRKIQNERIVKALGNPEKRPFTLEYLHNKQEQDEIEALTSKIATLKPRYEQAKKEEEGLKEKTQMNSELLKKLGLLEDENEYFEELENRLHYIEDKREWLEQQSKKITFLLMPLIRPHHWEDDVGGEQALNLQLPFIELTRINHKDLTAGLIFGSRISLFVGFAATMLALVIGVPLGLVSGYYGSTLDMLFCRFVEVWEAMPVFFMLLLVVTMLQTKSVFVVITVISVFSWMSAFRFVRAETFRQREMLYVDATKALGFPDSRILMRHILPNSILAILALLPFDIMAAITRESALAFLGLGEEQSCSWGVLMDEGREAFPAVSNLLWPPAIVLTVLLIAIAFVGEALQQAMDPKSEEQ